MSNLERPWGANPGDVVEADHTSVRDELRRRVGLLAPAWHANAACRGTDTALFFPTTGQSSKQALEICGGCDVRQRCLDEALADPDLDHGVRGAMSAQARKARRRLLAKGRAS